MAKPIIDRFHPPKKAALTAGIIIIYGAEFESAATVTVDGSAPSSTTWISASEIKIEIPNTITAGEKGIQITNPSDGKRSDAIPYLFFSEVSLGGRWRSNPQADQRKLPMEASFRGRTDTQRISAGNNYTGTIPDVENGESEGTRGGLWAYNAEVEIDNIEFSCGTDESSARTSPSGFYVVDRMGNETKIIDLENVSGNAWLTDSFILDKGEYIKLVTTGAAKAMHAKISQRAYNRRNK